MTDPDIFAKRVIQRGFEKLDLPSRFKTIIIFLLDRIDWHTHVAHPSQATLAKVAGCNVRTVRSHLKAAEKLRLLKVNRGNSRRASEYKLWLDHPLFRGDQKWVEIARKGIKAETWRGVDKRRTPPSFGTGGGEVLNTGGMDVVNTGGISQAEYGRYELNTGGTARSNTGGVRAVPPDQRSPRTEGDAQPSSPSERSDPMQLAAAPLAEPLPPSASPSPLIIPPQSAEVPPSGSRGGKPADPEMAALFDDLDKLLNG
jgi:hypothetical protein